MLRAEERRKENIWKWSIYNQHESSRINTENKWNYFKVTLRIIALFGGVAAWSSRASTSVTPEVLHLIFDFSFNVKRVLSNMLVVIFSSARLIPICQSAILG